MKYFIIAGEPSGDLHGSNLIRGLRKADSEAGFRLWGGDKMAEAAGQGTLLRHYRTASFFGLVQVVANIRTIAAQFAECREQIREYNPDAVILIDYPGFNLRIARFAKSIGLRTFYYIAPKVWAWKPGRIRQIRRHVDRLFIIFPFEAAYFGRRGVDALFEGNPLVDELEESLKNIPAGAEFRRSLGLDERPVIALLAGSRASEVKHMLPPMVDAARLMPGYRFVVAGASWLDRGIYDRAMEGSGVKIAFDRTYEILACSEAAVVTSGTATLEAALIGVPQVVGYRCDPLTAAAAQMVLGKKFFSLVNINLERRSVEELRQGDVNGPTIASELGKIVRGGAERERMLGDYARLRSIIGGPGASERFAARMVEELRKKQG